MAYKQQAMDFKWQIARKIDRIDIGSFAALEFFYRTAIIYGLVRAIDPIELDTPPEPSKGFIPIEKLVTSIDTRINELLEYDTTALLQGRMALPEVKTFQSKSMSSFYELMEIVSRCKLTDSVKVQEPEAP